MACLSGGAGERRATAAGAVPRADRAGADDGPWTVISLPALAAPPPAEEQPEEELVLDEEDMEAVPEEPPPGDTGGGGDDKSFLDEPGEEPAEVGGAAAGELESPVKLTEAEQRKIEEKVPKELIAGACLLCSEATPEHCHRRLVVEYLKSRWGDLEIVHL